MWSDYFPLLIGRARKIGVAIVAVLLVAIAAFVAGGWYLSDLIKDGGLVPKHEDLNLDLVVVDIGEDRVTLRVTPETEEDGAWRRRGVWGLEWKSGYGQVGNILQLTDEQVVREYVPPMGSPGTGDKARLDARAFRGDPQTAHGLPYEQVSFSSPLGEFPAWLVGGSRDTWVIFVHGRNSNRGEALRMLSTVAELGLPSLMITYRNDIYVDVPANPDGFHRYGQTEWEDLEGAAKYALDHGAEGIILVGYSMGGAIVTNFLCESRLKNKVRGIILDAPMLDFGATVDLGTREKGYPALFSTVAKAFAGLRFGIDWEELDYLRGADGLDVPILLFHGDADDVVPVETSDALAKARPDLVKYIRVADTGHVQAWNTDRAVYEAAVKAFIAEVAGR